MEQSDIVVTWTHNRRLHLIAPTGLLTPVDLAVVEKAASRLDDLDQVAAAVSEIMDRPVRARNWVPPTSDFFLEIETLG